MRMAVTIVGAGPAGLMAADVVSSSGIPVTIIDRKAQPARKFLLAGRGGLNLTHSEPLPNLLARYGAAEGFLTPMIQTFPPQAVRAWCEGLGQETFVGSSGRVFPCAMKASPLLRALLQRLASRGVELKRNAPWGGFDGTPTILAMGGASWPETGSDGAWVKSFRDAGIKVNDLTPSNGRVMVQWSDTFRARFAGQPIKNVALRHGNMHSRGEVMIARDGIEGGAIYALSPSLRARPDLPIVMDLKPALSGADVAHRLSRPRGRMSQSNFLRKALAFTPAAIALLHETKTRIDAAGVKGVAVQTQGLAGLSRAISSAGGVALGEVDAHCQLKSIPLTYCVGEMLDFDAPTGGYLLQACFSTAVAAARDLAQRLASPQP